MKDKKQEYESDILREINLDQSVALSMFPTLTPGTYQGLAVVDSTGYTVAYLAIELSEGAACALHLYIPEEHKNKENIIWLKSVFVREVHPWIKSQGKDYVIVTCPYEDQKTKELFITFGFDPSSLWMGLMQI